MDHIIAINLSMLNFYYETSFFCDLCHLINAKLYLMEILLEKVIKDFFFDY